MSSSPWMRRAAALALWSVCSARAADLAGVRLTDTTQVGGQVLRLKSAAVATRAMLLQIYVIGLYLPERRGPSAELFAERQPQRLALTMLRDVCGRDLVEAVRSAAGLNGSASERRRFSDYVAQIGAALERRECGLRRGDTLAFDWVPGRGTLALINGEALIEPQPDGALYGALLGVWLGDRPVDERVKAALLADVAPGAP